MATSLSHYAAGPCIVKWTPRDGSTGALGTTVVLGVNREAIPITITPNFLDVESDDWGGPDGVAADAQFMGATASISLSLTKILREGTTGVPDPLVEKMLDGLPFATPAHSDNSVYNGEDVGQHMIFGEFIRQGNYMGVLTLDSSGNARADNMSWVFNYAFVRGGGTQNAGTRYMSYDMEVEAWAGPEASANFSSNGVLYTKTFG